jgi:putative ABC transport system permease protein
LPSHLAIARPICMPERYTCLDEASSGQVLRLADERAAANRADRRQFGGSAQVKQEHSEESGFMRLEFFLKDVRYALRALRNNRAFSLTTILTLAVGIGANAAMFTVIRGVLLKPLSYREADFLVQISMDNSRHLATFTPIRYEELKAGAQSFSDIGAFGLPQDVMLSSGSESEQLAAARVSANFLQILGVSPLLGRTFTSEEDMPGGAPVAMISARLWQRRFGGDTLAIGKTATLDSRIYTIIGVLPAGFRFPFADADIWFPRPSEWPGNPPQSWSRTATLTGFARLKMQATIRQAQAEASLLNQQYIAAHGAMPDAKPGASMRVERMADALVVNVRRMLWTLFGSVGFVLLISCASVASLMLARAASRSREFAIRFALGASRSRVVEQLLAESLLLALAGGVLGLCLACWIVHEVTRMSASVLPRTSEIGLDSVVLGFTITISLLTAVIFGLFPSLWVSKPDLTSPLRERAGTQGVSNRWSARGLLVVGQVGLAIVLLIGATLLIKSFARLHQVNPGFQPANLLTMRITLAPTRYDSGRKITMFFEELVQRVETMPGVREATVARSLPMMPYQLVALQVAEQPALPFAERPLGELQTITGRYFLTLGIPLSKGRQFTEQDFKTGPPVLMVNESLARRFWPNYPGGPNPIGQHIQMGAGTPVEIVGITGDVHEAGLSLAVPPEVYLPARLSLFNPLAAFSDRQVSVDGVATLRCCSDHPGLPVGFPWSSFWPRRKAGL